MKVHDITCAWYCGEDEKHKCFIGASNDCENCGHYRYIVDEANAEWERRQKKNELTV